VGARQRVDATLQVGLATESVVVSDVAALIETDSSDRAQVMSTPTVSELPLNGRNYADLALLSTNVIKSPISFSFSPTGTPREGAFNVNGNAEHLHGAKFDVKIDGQIKDRMDGFIRYSQRKDQFYQPDIPGPTGGNGNGHIHAYDQNASAGYTWTLSPTSILEARFGYSRIVAGKTPPNIGLATSLAGFPFVGLPATPDLVGGLNSQNISGFSQLGRQTSNPQFQNPTSFDPKVNFSLIRGKHSIKGATSDATSYNLAAFQTIIAARRFRGRT
jgi:hypothetical protein